MESSFSTATYAATRACGNKNTTRVLAQSTAKLPVVQCHLPTLAAPLWQLLFTSFDLLPHFSFAAAKLVCVFYLLFGGKKNCTRVALGLQSSLPPKTVLVT